VAKQLKDDDEESLIKVWRYNQGYLATINVK